MIRPSGPAATIPAPKTTELLRNSRRVLRIMPIWRPFKDMRDPNRIALAFPNMTRGPDAEFRIRGPDSTPAKPPAEIRPTSSVTSKDALSASKIAVSRHFPRPGEGGVRPIFGGGFRWTFSGWQRQGVQRDESRLGPYSLCRWFCHALKPSASSEDSACRCHPESNKDRFQAPCSRAGILPRIDATKFRPHPGGGATTFRGGGVLGMSLRA